MIRIRRSPDWHSEVENNRMIHIPNPVRRPALRDRRRRRPARRAAAGLRASRHRGSQSAVIDVNRARTEPIPIAVPDLRRRRAAWPRHRRGDQQRPRAQRACSGLIDHAAFIQSGPSGSTPNFQNWKPTGAQALVTGSVQGSGGQVRVEFRLWDILPGTQIQGTAYTTTQSNWRRIAHNMADVIYERLLGEKGYFDTRIVYISATGPRDRRTKRLAIMDQDSENNRLLTDGSWLVLTPRFHPTRDEIAFMSYANNRPRVYLFDLTSGRQTQLGDFAGMTFAPRFAPDGSSVIMAVSNGGGSDIISVDLGSRASRRLTEFGIDRCQPVLQPGRLADRLRLRPRRRPADLS